MIADEHEYGVTRGAAQRLAAALAAADSEPAEPDPRHQQLMRAGLQSQLHDLQAELNEYKARLVRQRTGGAR